MGKWDEFDPLYDEERKDINTPENKEIKTSIKKVEGGMMKKEKTISVIKNIRKEFKEIRSAIWDEWGKGKEGGERFILEVILNHIGIGIKLCDRLDYDVKLGYFFIGKGIIGGTDKKKEVEIKED